MIKTISLTLFVLSTKSSTVTNQIHFHTTNFYIRFIFYNLLENKIFCTVKKKEQRKSNFLLFFISI